MSADKKLNKYLAKLKNTHDVKDAKVYINKIMKYKHMSGKQSGGAIEEDIQKGIADANSVGEKLIILSDELSKEQNITKYRDMLREAMPSQQGMTEQEIEKQITDTLKAPFEGTKTLLEILADLDKSDIPSGDKFIELLTQALKEGIDPSTGSVKPNIGEIITKLWDSSSPYKRGFMASKVASGEVTAEEAEAAKAK
jgi:hypothetical protein